jgi:H+-transporting ATPase
VKSADLVEVMELAVLLAAGLDDWVDFGVIIGILALNAAVGWYQEKQAADVVASLKGDIAMRAIVIRDSTQQEILARELVPGDVVCHCSCRIHFQGCISRS